LGTEKKEIKRKRKKGWDTNRGNSKSKLKNVYILRSEGGRRQDYLAALAVNHIGQRALEKERARSKPRNNGKFFLMTRIPQYFKLQLGGKWKKRKGD